MPNAVNGFSVEGKKVLYALLDLLAGVSEAKFVDFG